METNGVNAGFDNSLLFKLSTFSPEALTVQTAPNPPLVAMETIPPSWTTVASPTLSRVGRYPLPCYCIWSSVTNMPEFVASSLRSLVHLLATSWHRCVSRSASVVRHQSASLKSRRK